MKIDTQKHEIISEIELCHSGGRLNPDAIGWSRHPLHDCNLSGSRFRKKKWNYWCITGRHSMISLTIAHIDYASLAFAYFLDYKKNRFAEKAVTVLLPDDEKYMMPGRVHESLNFQHKNMSLNFAAVKTGYILQASIPSLNGEPLEAELHITVPDRHESTNVVIPWSKERFQYTSKQNCLPVSGSVAWGNSRYKYSSDATFACLDYGRGIWPYRSSWNWGSFSGVSDGNIVGLNAGAKWTNGTGMTENSSTLNGKIKKIFGDIVFDYNPHDFMKPWKLATPDSDEVDLVFTPFFMRNAQTNLFLIRSVIHQLFGHYSGTIRHGHKHIKIHNVVGWAEEHYARW